MDYSALKVTELKAELKKRNIPSTKLTRKQEIIDRLIQDDAESKDVLVADVKIADHKAVAAADEPLTAPVEARSQSPGATNESLDNDGLKAQPESVELIEIVKTQPKLTKDIAATVEGKSEPIHTQASIAEVQSPQSNAPAQIDQVAPESNGAPDLPTAKNDDSSRDDNAQSVAHEHAMQDVNAQEVVSTASAPEPASEIADSVPPSNDSRKRKDRNEALSVTEPIISKKLKHANDDISSLDKDNVFSTQDHANVKPDTRMDDAIQQAQAPVSALHAPSLQDSAQVPSDETKAGLLHPPTSCLYITDLSRPINVAALEEHLNKLARIGHPTDSQPEPHVKLLHVDTLRTHAFVMFRSDAAAAQVLGDLRGRNWPEEPARKPLGAFFLPSDKCQEFIDIELGRTTSNDKDKTPSNGTRTSNKRWEVAYSGPDGTHVKLVEVSGHDSPSVTHTREDQQGKADLRPEPQPKITASENPSFRQLDDCFKFTSKAKPKLYWLPVKPDLVDRRRAELRSLTSRDWDARADHARNRDTMGQGLDQLRRFTFEDGDVLVDGGPEFGGRGGHQGRNRGRGGGRFDRNHGRRGDRWP